MARNTNITFKAFIDANVNTNGVRAITGALLNEALTMLSDSLFFAWSQSQTEVIKTSTNPNTITFDTAFLSGETYQLVIRNYDANGSNVDYQITEMVVTGFKIVTAADSTLHYFTILNV